jgi:hypothetical protein
MNDCESAQKAAKFKADDQTSIFKIEREANLLAIFSVCKQERSRKATV